MPKTHTMFAQRCPRILIERLYIMRDLRPGNDPERLNKLMPNALGKPGQRLVLLDRQQRLKQRVDPSRQPVAEPPFDLFGDVSARRIINENLDVGC